MELSYFQLEISLEALKKLSDIKLPAKISYCVSKNIYILTKHAKNYYNELGILANSFALKDEEGNFVIKVIDGITSYTFETDKLKEEYIKERTAISSKKVNVDFYLIDLEKHLEGFEIEPELLSILLNYTNDGFSAD